MTVVTKYIILLVIFFSITTTLEKDNVAFIPSIGVPKTTTYAGYVCVNVTYGANLYYLFWESQNITPNTPIVMWLQGGPGYSSMFGSFVENGPYIINANGTFYENPYSWNLNAHMLYVDQPVGTGYSYVENINGYVRDEQTMAEELLTLLVNFFELHPQYANLDFFIFGESYAGKFIPSVSKFIIEYSDINLRAIGIGDGLIAPEIQIMTYCPYLLSRGLVTEDEVIEQMKMYERYMEFVNLNKTLEANSLSYSMLLFCSIKGGYLDYYDINYHLFDNPTNDQSDALQIYFNDPDVKMAFNANHTFTMASKKVLLFMSDDFNLSEKLIIKNLLQNELPVLLYNGFDDIICNYIGTEMLASVIDWSGQEGFNNATFNDVYLDNQLVGKYKYYYGLTFNIIYNAGHMVPFYQPQVALNMFESYLRNYNLTWV